MRERLGRHAPASWLARFTQSLRYYFQGCIRETHFRQSNTVPTVAEYMELRRASFGYAPMADLMELIFGTYLTDEERHSLQVIRLRTLGVDISANVNDLYSYEKENAVGDVCNIVKVVELNEGMDHGGHPARDERQAPEVRRRDEAVVAPDVAEPGWLPGTRRDAQPRSPGRVP